MADDDTPKLLTPEETEAGQKLLRPRGMPGSWLDRHPWPPDGAKITDAAAIRRWFIADPVRAARLVLLVPRALATAAAYHALCARIEAQGCEDQLHQSHCKRWKITGMAASDYFPDNQCTCGLGTTLPAPAQAETKEPTHG